LRTPDLVERIVAGLPHAEYVGPAIVDCARGEFEYRPDER